MKKGHIKGAVNLMEDPFFDPETLDQYKVFLGKDKLLKGSFSISFVGK